MEILHHFSCNKCSGWWSIATEFAGQYSDVIEKQKWYCPWCGEKSYYDEPSVPVGGEVSSNKNN